MDNTTPSVKKFGKRIGQSGTTIFSGIVTNEEYNQLLVGLNGIRKFEIMRKSDPTVHAALEVVKLPIRQAEWFIESASDDEQDEYNQKFIKHELFDGKVNWEKLIREILTELDFGHSIIEKTLGLTEFDGKTRVGIEELGWRKQTSILKWETQDGLPGITQQIIGSENVSIPREKLIYFVHQQEGDNYQGVSLLRYVFKAWDLKDKMELINGVGLERQAVGVPMVEVLPDQSPEEIAVIDELMRQFRANEEGYIRKPKGTSVEMLDMKAGSTKDTLPTIQYYDRQIFISVLAQFLSLGASGASGSRAVSDDQSKLFLMSEGALARQIQTVIQKELIEPLCDLNFSTMPNGYPQLKFGKIGDDNVVELGDYVHKLTTAGAMKYDPRIDNQLRKVGGLPTMSEDEIEEARKQLEEERKNPPETKPAVKPVDKKTEEDLKTQAALKASKDARKNLIDIVTG